MLNNFLVIGCVASTDCPNQKACINKLCVDPCHHSNPCTGDQECQVMDHGAVCVRGKSNCFYSINFM